MLPSTIDFRITSKCNMCCSFCFGTKEREQICINSQIDFLEKLRKKGVENIVLTGGEPTSIPEFASLLRALCSMGYRIALSTNGSYWTNNDIRNAIQDYVSCISLPVESSDPTVHNLLRTGIPNHFEMVHHILQDISNSEINIHVKISTVVTKINESNLEGILDNLPIQPQIWKLYQLSACRFNKGFYDKYCMSNTQFENCINKLQKIYIKKPTKIVSARELDRDRKYLFLEPDGSLKTIIDNQECLIGHTSDPEEVLYSKIEEMVDHEKIDFNFYNSFT